jgi:hypothetical protein
MTERPYDELPKMTRRRLLIRAVLRPTLMIIGLLLLYYLLPLVDRAHVSATVSLLLGLIAVSVLLTWQISKIRTSPYPRLRAIEALSLSAPLFILVFATVYYVTSDNTPGSFSQHLGRTSSLYFTVTVFSSVGFGDIVPVSDTARVMVMFQMLGDLVLIGVVARAILSAVQSGLNRQPATSPGEGHPGQKAPDPDST